MNEILPNLAKRAKIGPSPGQVEPARNYQTQASIDVGPQTGILTRQRSLKMEKEQSIASLYGNNQNAQAGTTGIKLTPMMQSKPRVQKSNSRLFDNNDAMLSSNKKSNDEDLMKNTPVDYRPAVKYDGSGGQDFFRMGAPPASNGNDMDISMFMNMVNSGTGSSAPKPTGLKPGRSIDGLMNMNSNINASPFSFNNGMNVFNPDESTPRNNTLL